jgi:hypothetical protein
MQDGRILKLETTETMLDILKKKGRSLDMFHKGDTVEVWNKMVKGYEYRLEEEPGENLDPDFKPYLNPGEMLAMGIFEGKYMNDELLEFPAEWFLRAIALDKLRPGKPDISANYFQILSRQPLPKWVENGWAPPLRGKKRHHNKMGRDILGDPKKNPDERGWFQWYCRYWMGRRIPDLDKVQIGRWKNFQRHAGQIRANCRPGDQTCRPRQRQALLQWAHNPFI